MASFFRLSVSLEDTGGCIYLYSPSRSEVERLDVALIVLLQVGWLRSKSFKEPTGVNAMCLAGTRRQRRLVV